MATKSTGILLTILPEKLGIEDLQIHKTKLPTHLQVILCYMALLEKVRQEDETKQKKLYHFAATFVVKEILPHYQKSQMKTIHEHKMAEKILALFKEYENLRVF